MRNDSYRQCVMLWLKLGMSVSLGSPGNLLQMIPRGTQGFIIMGEADLEAHQFVAEWME